MTMNPHAAACTENRSDRAGEITQKLDSRDAANCRRMFLQFALMIALTALPGADKARAVGRLEQMIDEAHAAGVRAVELLQAQVQQLGGRVV